MNETRKWIFHRISAIILAPLFAWFYFSLISLSDSVLISKIFFSMANLISSKVLPIPEKTIFCGFIPALRAIKSSPFETTSAPIPNFFISFKI